MITNNKIPQGQLNSEVSQTITYGVTDKAPSENAVFDALALKKNYIQMTLSSNVLSPADNSTYYFSNRVISPTTTATNHAFKFGYNGTIIGAIIQEAGNTTAGSTESAQIQLRNVTQSTSTVISSDVKTNGSATVTIALTVTGLNIPFLGTDDICLQFNTPAYITNPVGVYFNVYLMIEL